MTDKQLTAAQGGLGCMALPNPNNPKHGDMKLYLRSQAGPPLPIRRPDQTCAPPRGHTPFGAYFASQVEAVALGTWHTEEALLLEKERRREERVRKAEAKRKAKAQREGKGDDDGSPAKRGRATGRPAEDVQAALARLAPRLHEHCYVREEYDEATDMWTRYCECGFSERYERM